MVAQPGKLRLLRATPYLQKLASIAALRCVIRNLRRFSLVHSTAEAKRHLKLETLLKLTNVNTEGNRSLGWGQLALWC